MPPLKQMFELKLCAHGIWKMYSFALCADHVKGPQGQNNEIILCTWKGLFFDNYNNMGKFKHKQGPNQKFP